MEHIRQWYASLNTRVRVGLGTVFALALGGIIGNRADALVLWAANEGPTWLALAVSSPVTTFAVGVVTSALGLILGWQLRGRIALGREQALSSQVQELEGVGQKAELLLRLDAELIRSMPELLNRNEREETIRRLARAWIRECAAVFAPDVSRVTILRPIDDDWLEPWEAYGMPESSLRSRRFHIGQPPDPVRRRGRCVCDRGVSCRSHRPGRRGVARRRPGVRRIRGDALSALSNLHRYPGAFRARQGSGGPLSRQQDAWNF